MRRFASIELDRAVLLIAGVIVSMGCQLIGGFEDHRLAETDAGSGGSVGAGASSVGGQGAGADGGGGGNAGGAPVGGTGTGGNAGSPECGNGVIEAGNDGDVSENCDDGATTSGDGCSADCQIECGERFEVVHPVTGHCYKYDPNFPKSWYEASPKCAAWFGTLAVVTDSDERDFLLASYGHTIASWLGASYSREEGGYVWETGEPFAFQPWKSGEPSVDACVVFQPDGLWYSYDCSYVGKPFFCERATGLP